MPKEQYLVEPDLKQDFQEKADKSDTSTQGASSSKEDTNHETIRNHSSSENGFDSNKPKETNPDDYDYDTSDEDEYIGTVEKNPDYEPLGSIPRAPRTRKAPKPFTKEELNRLRSNGSPLELESLPANGR